MGEVKKCLNLDYIIFKWSLIITGVMALVIFFVPDPAVGLAEMKRVVKPGGTVAAYVWDVFEEGLPMQELFSEFRLVNVH